MDTMSRERILGHVFAGNTPISLEQVRKTVPSVFMNKPHSKLSDRYAFISTASILERLMKDHNYEIFAATQRATRKGGRDPRFTRHQIIMRPAGSKPIVGDNYSQIVLSNSHDGQSKIDVLGGIFRTACTNSLVTTVANSFLSKTHRGDPKEIVDGILATLAQTAKTSTIINQMMKKKLTAAQQSTFAKKAAKAAYDEPLSFDPALLLGEHREADKGNDVWRVFNRIQENVVRGGVRFESKASGREFTTRGLTHIGRTIDINTQLWTMAEELVTA